MNLNEFEIYHEMELASLKWNQIEAVFEIYKNTPPYLFDINFAISDVLQTIF